MSTEDEQSQPTAAPDNDPNPWKSRTAAIIILGTFGLVAYVTVTTGSIPANVALPLLAAAAFGLWAFKLDDFTGRRRK